MSLSRVHALTRRKILYGFHITTLLPRTLTHLSIKDKDSPNLQFNKGLDTHNLVSHFHHSTFENRHWFSTVRGKDDASEKPIDFSKVDARFLPTVLLIGRPNVGKSALFNRLIRRREALVYNTPNDHVTRDIREGIAKLGDLRFKVLDSAGLEAEASSGSVLQRTAEMTANVLKMSNLALFLVDARDGLQPMDLDVGKWLRKHAPGVKTIMIMNKAESLDDGFGSVDAAAGEARVLGFGDPIAISAETGLGMNDLYEVLRPLLEEHMIKLESVEESNEDCESCEEEESKLPLQLAFVGRPNVGKSTLLNAILEEDRVLVGPEAGLTRDSVRVEFEFEGRKVYMVDTAGWLQRIKSEKGAASLSVVQSKKNLMRAHVVALVLDGEEVSKARKSMTHDEVVIARRSIEEGRGLVVIVNKMDLLKERLYDRVVKAVPEEIQTIIPQAIEQQGGGSSDDFQDSSSKEKVVKNRFITDDALDDRICDLYDLYVDGLDEDAGPQVRKLYSELAALWPDGCIDNHEIKRAICRAKDRRKALYRRKDGEAYTYLLNVLAPEHCSPATLDTKDPAERENLVLEHAEKMDCKRYLAPKDIVEGSSNLNLAFVAQIFHQRNGLSTDTKKISFAEMMTDDEQMSRDERCFRLWINSLGISSYINNLFEDVRNGWTLLEVLDRVSVGSVNWKHATKPPIKMPFRKVENCNQVIKIGKQLKFSLVNVAGNDFVQGNKKLILAFLWQLMRFNMLQLLKNLRSSSQGKEMTDADILKWANKKVKITGRLSQMESFKDKSLSNGLFFLELLSAVEPRVVNWNLVTKGENEEEKKLNATYIISVARKLGCSIFLLPEDIMEVNQKMILMLTASIMYWSLQQSSTTDEMESSPSSVAATPEASPAPSINGDDESSVSAEIFNLSIDDAASDTTVSSTQENNIDACLQ